MRNIRLFKSLIYLLLISVLLLSAGCHKPSEADIERLNILKNKYGNKFHFKLEGQFYLRVRLKHEAQVDEEELRAIYRTFFFDKSGEKQRDTSYVYLNFYDSKGKFQYQIVYNFMQDRFGKSNAEHY